MVVGGAIYSKLFLWGNEINSGIFVRRKKREHCIFIVHKRSLQRLCFYTCQSFCSQVGCPGPGLGGSLPRGVSRPGGCPGPWGVYPSMHWGRHHPPSRRPLQRMVRILLECILVCWHICKLVEGKKAKVIIDGRPPPTRQSEVAFTWTQFGNSNSNSAVQDLPKFWIRR